MNPFGFKIQFNCEKLLNVFNKEKNNIVVIHHSRPHSCCLFSIILCPVWSWNGYYIFFYAVWKSLHFFDSSVWRVMQCKHQWEELEACTEIIYFYICYCSNLNKDQVSELVLVKAWTHFSCASRFSSAWHAHTLILKCSASCKWKALAL